MGKGLAQPLLLATKQAFSGASPLSKITPPGFLQALLAQTKPNIISTSKDDGSGYLRDVKIRYRKRVPPGKTTTTDDCSIQAKPAYSEVIVPSTMFRKYALFFEDDEISRFEHDALALVKPGTAATTVVNELMEAVIEAANGVLADINADLLSLQAANWGKNAVTGSNAAKTINFVLNSTTNPLNQGMTEVMSDVMLNEFKMPGLFAVGSGLINNYYLQQSGKSADQAGVNTNGLMLPKLYVDPYAVTSWGANKFGLFEANSVQFINICRFRGPKAGQRGADEFGTMFLPLSDSWGNPIGALEFDWQKRIITCPTEVTIGGAEAPTTVGRGVVLDLMCSYTSLNIPADSYEATDRLFGNNGTLLYTATNA
ncbi:hypothetical protein QTN47_17065 [Danxiaibacter flavus]|uniref:Uncharacterized protein n=1 Tax=Danxiaibacter flavus TaxID=3049108 RepID=A0ABV3ZKZ2_9BACT|nr:hypothetical protein QNM32_17075 [Chitinophagaceae bacterium DXS]